MIVHVVLFQPRADLPDAERDRFLENLSTAAGTIASIRRFHVGRRVRHGLRGYEQGMTQSFDFAAVAEFDDMAGLKAYLTHPAHDAVGRHFEMWAERALAYDYEMVEATEAASLRD